MTCISVDYKQLTISRLLLLLLLLLLLPLPVLIGQRETAQDNPAAMEFIDELLVTMANNENFSKDNDDNNMVMKNLCTICKIDMGECNPRQLCGKTRCLYSSEDNNGDDGNGNDGDLGEDESLLICEPISTEVQKKREESAAAVAASAAAAVPSIGKKRKRRKIDDFISEEKFEEEASKVRKKAAISWKDLPINAIMKLIKISDPVETKYGINNIITLQTRDGDEYCVWGKEHILKSINKAKEDDSTGQIYVKTYGKVKHSKDETKTYHRVEVINKKDISG